MLGDSDTSVDDRLILQRALGRIPRRQRAVLILRYWEDISIEDVAEALGCSTGTVKSQSARGLQALRAVHCRRDRGGGRDDSRGR